MFLVDIIWQRINEKKLVEFTAPLKIVDSQFYDKEYLHKLIHHSYVTGISSSYSHFESIPKSACGIECSKLTYVLQIDFGGLIPHHLMDLAFSLGAANF